MLSLLRTLLDGAGAKAEDRLKDQFAVDLLAQRIRDAEAGLACAKQTLASLIVRQRAEQASLDQLDRRIADLEPRHPQRPCRGCRGPRPRWRFRHRRTGE
ncbi:hypothetical protein [Mesorhizobium sp.]|uniref:PspA/IM30 family protein n=1 Tax=Mesorhizobium sp. TaxID=1871066 RepID=UPI0025B82902|nr:hypothetical protein [Mesorhizobium sp.]